MIDKKKIEISIAIVHRKNNCILTFGFPCLALSHENKTIAIAKLDTIRKTIEERTKNLKSIIDTHRQTLAKHIDNHIQSLEQT